MGNFKQVALAAHNYASSNRELLPPLVLQWGTTQPVEANFTLVNTAFYSGLVELLPYVEEKPAYDFVDYVRPAVAPYYNNAPAISILRCPNELENKKAASVKLNQGVGNTWPKDNNDKGPFELIRKNSMAKMRDGLSNTILLCESSDSGSWWQSRESWNTVFILGSF